MTPPLAPFQVALRARIVARLAVEAAHVAALHEDYDRFVRKIVAAADRARAEIEAAEYDAIRNVNLRFEAEQAANGWTPEVEASWERYNAEFDRNRYACAGTAAA